MRLNGTDEFSILRDKLDNYLSSPSYIHESHLHNYIRLWMRSYRNLMGKLEVVKKELDKYKKQELVIREKNQDNQFLIEKIKADNNYKTEWGRMQVQRESLQQQYDIIIQEEQGKYNREKLRVNKDITVAKIKTKSNERIELAKLKFEMAKVELKEERLLREFERKNPTKKPKLKKINKLFKGADNYHTYISGGTGGGKSEVIKTIVKIHLDSDNKCVIIIDPKNDLSEQVAKFKDNDADRLVYLNPTLKDDCNFVLNPFDLSLSFIKSNKSLITESIVNSFKLMLDGDLTTSMKAFLQPCIDLMLYHPSGSFKTLHDVLKHGSEGTDIQDKDYVTLYKNVYSDYLDNGTYKATKEAMIRRLDAIIYNDDFRLATTEKSTVDLSELIEQNKLVIFNLKKMADKEVFGAFLISQIQNITMSRHVDNINNETYLVIDECHNFITPTIDKILDEARSSKLFLVMAHQHLSQITSKNTKEAIESSASLKIATRQTAKRDLEEMARLMSIDTNQLESLRAKEGECFIKVETNQAELVRNKSKLLAGNHSCTPDQWEEIKAQQLKTYYKCIDTKPVSAEKEAPIEKSLNDRQKKIIESMEYDKKYTTEHFENLLNMVSESTVKRDLKKLEKQGYIKVEKNRSDKGTQKFNKYTLCQ